MTAATNVVSVRDQHSGVNVDPEHFFYHSFPRSRAGRDQHALGLSILESILKDGLLLAPESRRFAEPTQGNGAGDPGPILLAQKRICFTHLSAQNLKSHAEMFGPFSLEWKEGVLRSLGAIPVFYVPLQWSEGSLEGIGSALLARLAEVQAVLTRIEQIENAATLASSPDEAIIITRPNEPDLPSRLSAAGAKDFVSMLQFEHQRIGTLRNAVQALSGFFSPVEDLRYTTPLGYYQQREWRIIANMVHLNEALTAPLADPIKQRLLSADADYWGATIEMPTGLSRRVDQCQLFQAYSGRPISETINRVIVPRASVGAVQQLMNACGVSLPVAELEAL